MSIGWRSRLLHGSVSVLAVALALLLTLLLEPRLGKENPFLLFFAAVVVSAWYGGLGFGLLATALAASISNYCFLVPTHTLKVNIPSQNLQMGLFVCEGVLIVAALHAQRHQDNLPQTAELHCLMVDNVKDYAIFRLNPDGSVASWNLGAQSIFGYQSAEIISQPFDRLFSPEDIQSGQPERELRSAAAAGRADDKRWQIRQDGTRFWASGSLTALRDEAGTLRGFAKVLRDTTEDKQAEEALRESELGLTH